MQQPQLKLTPSDVEAEIAVLGCILMDQSLITIALDRLVIDDFYDQKNKLIFKAIVELSNDKKSIDVSTITSKLKENNQFDIVGYNYFSEIAEHGFMTENIDSYIDMIIVASQRRNAINTLLKLADSGYDTKTSSVDYIDYVERTVFDLAKNRNVEQFTPIKTVSQNVLDSTTRAAARQTEIIGLDTGYDELNKLTAGFQPGQLIILAARPAMGKSAMALNLAYNVAVKNKASKASVAVFSLEMSSEQLVQRMLACESSIELGRIINGSIQKQDWIRFTTSCSKLSGLNIYFDDASDVNIAKIRAKCRKLKVDQGLDFIVIDYLQLIEPDSQSAHASTIEKITKITRSLKLMARELEVPILCLSQLSRKVEERDEKKPIMSDLRDSGSIEQDADIVMFLYREDYYNAKSERKGEADLILAKNRSGSTSEGIPFMFRGKFQSFKEKKDEEAYDA